MNVMVGFMAEFNARFSWNPPYSYEAVCWVIWFIFMLEYPLIFSCWNTPSYVHARIPPHIFKLKYSLIFSCRNIPSHFCLPSVLEWRQTGNVKFDRSDYITRVFWFQFVVNLDLSRLARVDLNKKMLQTTPYCFCYEFYEGEGQRSHIGGKVTRSSRRLQSHNQKKRSSPRIFVFQLQEWRQKSKW